MAAEWRLEQRGAIDDLAHALAATGGDALRIRVVFDASVVNLRAAPDDPSLITDVQRVLGLELPLEPNRWHGDDRLAALWLGPDEWLLVGRQQGAGPIARDLREARPIDPWLSVVDLSHHYTRMSLSGAEVRNLLAKGCSLDLRPSAFSPGDCARTLFAKSRVLLRSHDENSFDLWVSNSFARYLAEWLLAILEPV